MNNQILYCIISIIISVIISVSISFSIKAYSKYDTSTSETLIKVLDNFSERINSIAGKEFEHDVAIKYAIYPRLDKFYEEIDKLKKEITAMKYMSNCPTLKWKNNDKNRK